MRKTALAALMFSIFGTGSALANCESAWISWTKCESCYGKGHVRRGTSGWFFRCAPCVNSYCDNRSYREDVSDPELMVKQLAQEEVDKIELGTLNIRGADVKKIALEIAEKNSLVGAFFIDVYMVSNRSGVFIQEDGVLGSGDEIVKSENDFKNAKEFIEKYNLEGGFKGEGCASKERVKFRYDYNTRRLADGSAYMRIRVSEINEEEKEVREIFPVVNIKMRAAQDDAGSYWEPVGWNID